MRTGRRQTRYKVTHTPCTLTRLTPSRPLLHLCNDQELSGSVRRALRGDAFWSGGLPRHPAIIYVRFAQARTYPCGSHPGHSRDISRQSAPMPTRPWECTPHRKCLTRRSPRMRPRLTAYQCLTSRRRGRSDRPAPNGAGRGPVTASPCHYHFQPSVDRKAPARGRFRVAILPPGKYPAAGVLWCQGTRQRVLGPVD